MREILRTCPAHQIKVVLLLTHVILPGAQKFTRRLAQDVLGPLVQGRIGGRPTVLAGKKS